MSLEDGEAKNWSELSYDDKQYVVRILKENGYTNAEEAVNDLNFNYEQASFGRFWLAINKDDVDDLQSFF